MSLRTVFFSLPVALVLVVGAVALRPTPAFSQSPSCSTYSCTASFQACIKGDYCGGCSPYACVCKEYATPVWYTSDCAPTSNGAECFCPIDGGDGTGGNTCDGLWQISYDPCSGE